MNSVQALPRSGPWLVLSLVVLAEALLSVGRSAIGPLAPLMQSDLGLSRAEVGLLVSAIYVGATLVILPFGWLADSLSVRYLLLIGQGIAGLFVIALMGMHSLAHGLLLMFLSGVGLGVCMPATTKAVMTWFSSTTRGMAMSVKQTGVSVGGAIALAALPGMGLMFGWRLSMAMVGAATVASGAIAYALYRGQPVTGFDPARVAVKSSLSQLLGNRDLLLVSVSSAIWAAIQVAFATYIVLFLVEKLNMSVVAAGSLAAVSQIVGSAGRVGGGVISDLMFGSKRKPLMLIFGALIALCAQRTSALAPGSTALVLGAVVIGFGLAVFGWAGIYVVLISELAGRRLVGAATGLSMGMSFVGVIVGPPIFGYIVDRNGSYQTAWNVLAVAGAVATCLLLLVREGSKGDF